MKALSMTQPWASLVILGEKRWETSSWRCAHTGWLAIHAAKSFPAYEQSLCLRDPWRKALQGYRVFSAKGLPRGKILGWVWHEGDQHTEDVRVDLPQHELAVGDYSSGRWAWRLTKPHMLVTPISCVGHLGVWPLPGHIQAYLDGAIQKAEARERC